MTRYDAQWPDVIDAEARARFRVYRHACRIAEYFGWGRAWRG